MAVDFVKLFFTDTEVARQLYSGCAIQTKYNKSIVPTDKCIANNEITH